MFVKLLVSCAIVALSTCQPPMRPESPELEHFSHEVMHDKFQSFRRQAQPSFQNEMVSPEDREFFENELPIDGEIDPVVGVGLHALPLMGAMAGAKLKAGSTLLAAEAHAFHLKHKAEMEKALIDAKLKHDLIASKARMAGHKLLFHSAILGKADHNPGPEDAPEAIEQDIDRDMGGVRNGEKQTLPEMISNLHEMFAKQPVKRDVPQQSFRGPHMQHDEELFLWSLNNVGMDSGHLRQELPEALPQPERQLPETSEQAHPDVNIPIDEELPEDPFEDTEELKPLDEVQGNVVPEDNGFVQQRTADSVLTRMNPRHFGHFHHKGFGIHKGYDGFSAGVHGSSAPGLGGHGLGGFGKFGRPTSVTINNQQNTFTNAVPTSAGNANFQISQSTGQAGSSQSHSASNQGLHHQGHGHAHGHGFRQAEDPKLGQPKGAGAKMQRMQQNLRMTSPTIPSEEPKLGQAQDMGMASHFLGMRGLMPAQSGSMVMITPNHQPQNQ